MRTIATRPRYLASAQVERDLDATQGLVILFGILSVALAVFAGGEALLLKNISDHNKALPQTLLCFNMAGDVTNGDDWRECRSVRYLPPPRDALTP